MPRKLTTIVLSLLAAALLVAASAGAEPGFQIYENDMNSQEQKKDFFRVSGRACERGGSEEALRVTFGRKTRECIYRTPVIGRNLEIIVTERLLSGTPRRLARRTFLAVNLRSAEGAGRYQLRVFPVQRKYQLIKAVPGERPRYLAVGKQISAIRGINKGNRVRLRAFNRVNTPAPNDCRLLVYVNGERLAVVTDERSGKLEGRETTFSAGSRRGARNAVVSFDNVKIRVPRPF